MAANLTIKLKPRLPTKSTLTRRESRLYIPQANGIVARLNRTIGEMLRKTTDHCDDNWDIEISFGQFHYMNHDHTATGNCLKASANILAVGIISGLSFQISTVWSCHSWLTSNAKESCLGSSGAKYSSCWGLYYDVYSRSTWIPY